MERALGPVRDLHARCLEPRANVPILRSGARSAVVANVAVVTAGRDAPSTPRALREPASRRSRAFEDAVRVGAIDLALRHDAATVDVAGRSAGAGGVALIAAAAVDRAEASAGTVGGAGVSEVHALVVAEARSRTGTRGLRRVGAAATATGRLAARGAAVGRTPGLRLAGITHPVLVAGGPIGAVRRGCAIGLREGNVPRDPGRAVTRDCGVGNVPSSAPPTGGGEKVQLARSA